MTGERFSTTASNRTSGRTVQLPEPRSFHAEFLVFFIEDLTLNELRKRDKNARLAEHFISFSQRV